MYSNEMSHIPLPLGSASKIRTPSSSYKATPLSAPQHRPPQNLGTNQNYQRAVATHEQQQQSERDEKANFSVTQRQWLNLLLTVANKSLDKLGLARPMVLKDLDTLTPDLLRRLLILLLTSAGECDESEFGPKAELLDPERTLKTFNNIYVDTTVIHLYWKVKKVFPDKDDMFDYSILYYPAKDPKRTKAVLKYLTAYLCFTESIYEKFVHTLNECHGIIKEQQEGLAEIEDLKTKLNAKIVEVEEWQAELPKVQARDLETIKELESVEALIPEIEEKISHHKKIYDGIELDNQNIESQLTSMNIKIKDLEGKRVYNAETTIQKHTDEKTQLDRALQTREDLTAKREKLGEEENFLSTLNEEAKQCATELEEFVEEMKETVALAEKAIKTEQDHRIKKQKLEDLWLKVKKSGLRKERLKSKFNETRQNLVNEKQRCVVRLENKKTELENRQEAAEAVVGTLRQLIALDTTALANLHKVHKEIARVKEYIDTEIPSRLEELMRKIKSALEELALPLELKIQRFNATYRENNER